LSPQFNENRALLLKRALNLVSRLHKAGAVGRTRQYHVTLVESHEFGDVLNLLADLEYHVLRVALLLAFPIDAQVKIQILAVVHHVNAEDVRHSSEPVTAFLQAPRCAVFLKHRAQITVGKIDS
jgi:hypothetical protein